MHDDYITMSEAAKRTPGRPASATIWRWARKGIRTRTGSLVRLRHIRAGGRIYTRAEWLQAFFDEVANADIAAGQPAPPESESIVIPHEQADRELRAAGL